jgi:hypothetical protein
VRCDPLRSRLTASFAFLVSFLLGLHPHESARYSNSVDPSFIQKLNLTLLIVSFMFACSALQPQLSSVRPRQPHQLLSAQLSRSHGLYPTRRRRHHQHAYCSSHKRGRPHPKPRRARRVEGSRRRRSRSSVFRPASFTFTETFSTGRSEPFSSLHVPSARPRPTS